MAIIIDTKKEFIDSIALRSAVNAASQIRSKKFHVFAKSIIPAKSDTREDEQEKIKLKKNVISFWKDCIKKQSQVFFDGQKNIDDFFISVSSLKEMIDDKYGEYFEGGEIRIAQCQKSLSVYLKWMWCLEWMRYEPVVCPIDRNVLNFCYKNLDKQNDKDSKKLIRQVFKDGGWGQINDMKLYKELVGITKKLSDRQNLSIAEWELTFFNSVIEDDTEDSE